MLKKIFPKIFEKFQSIKRNEQLYWAIFLFFLLSISFGLVIGLFVSILKEAQEKNILLEIEHVQNTLPNFFEIRDKTEEQKKEIVLNFVQKNPTIQDISFYKKDEKGLENIFSSNNIKKDVYMYSFVYAGEKALLNKDNSYTYTEHTDEGITYYTYRSFEKDEEIILVETVQNFPKESLYIEYAAKKAAGVSIFILFIVIFVFFKYTKVVQNILKYEEENKVNNLKNDFISIIRKYFEKPLTLIEGYSESVLDLKEISKEDKTYIEKINTSSKDLKEITQKIIEVSKLQTDDIELKKEKILVPHLIKNIDTFFNSICKQKNIEFIILQEGLKFSHIDGDKNKIIEAISYVLMYFIKNNNTEKIIVSISNIEHILEIKIGSREIVLTKEDIRKLFDKFYITQYIDKNHMTEIGVEFWIVKQLIEKMDGDISTQSNPADGTEISIKFKAY